MTLLALISGETTLTFTIFPVPIDRPCFHSVFMTIQKCLYIFKLSNRIMMLHMFPSDLLFHFSTGLFPLPLSRLKNRPQRVHPQSFPARAPGIIRSEIIEGSPGLINGIVAPDGDVSPLKPRRVLLPELARLTDNLVQGKNQIMWTFVNAVLYTTIVLVLLY